MAHLLSRSLSQLFSQPERWYCGLCIGLALGLLWQRIDPLSVTAAGMVVSSGVVMLVHRFWGRISAIGLLVLFALVAVVVNLQQGFSVAYAVGGVIAAGMAWGLWPRSWPEPENREDDEKESSTESVSLVLLLSEARFLDAHLVRQAAEAAFGEEFGDEDDDNYECFVVGHAPTLLVKYHHTILAVQSLDRTFVEDPSKMPQQFGDELRRAFAGHTAWISVEVVSSDDEEEVGSLYQTVARMLSSLYDTDALVIFCPGTGQLALCDTLTESRLRSEDPLGEIFSDSTPGHKMISPDDPRLEAATAEALRRWPEFVEAFGRRKPGAENFVVKTQMIDGPRREDMWVTVKKIEDETIIGELDDEPMRVRNIRFGDSIEIRLGDLKDWAIVGGEKKLRGGFTLRLPSRGRTA